MIGSPGPATVLAAVCGYLIGSIPVAVLVSPGARCGHPGRRGRNPGYWNAKESLGRRAALPVFVGDVAKGSAAAAIGVIVGGPWWVGYVGGAAAMIGHAWPVFAGFRGGRSVLTFVGAMIVLAPVPAAIAAAVCIVVTLVSRSFALGARVAVFGFPLIQAWFEPRARVAATGALMAIIGLRFAMAATRHARRAAPSARVGPIPPRAAGPDGTPGDPGDGRRIRHG